MLQFSVNLTLNIIIVVSHRCEIKMAFSPSKRTIRMNADDSVFLLFLSLFSRQKMKTFCGWQRNTNDENEIFVASLTLYYYPIQFDGNRNHSTSSRHRHRLCLSLWMFPFKMNVRFFYVTENPKPKWNFQFVVVFGSCDCQISGPFCACTDCRKWTKMNSTATCFGWAFAFEYSCKFTQSTSVKHFEMSTEICFCFPFRSFWYFVCLWTGIACRVGIDVGQWIFLID